jgi:hypothetical protein
MNKNERQPDAAPNAPQPRNSRNARESREQPRNDKDNLSHMPPDLTGAVVNNAKNLEKNLAGDRNGNSSGNGNGAGEHRREQVMQMREGRRQHPARRAKN